MIKTITTKKQEKDSPKTRLKNHMLTFEKENVPIRAAPQQYNEEHIITNAKKMMLFKYDWI